MDRALLVDVIPPEQQATANAWASRMFGVGCESNRDSLLISCSRTQTPPSAVFGFWIGGVDLVRVTGGFLGDEQLKVDMHRNQRSHRPKLTRLLAIAGPHLLHGFLPVRLPCCDMLMRSRACVDFP